MRASEKFQTKKSLGQHFLTSDVVPTWMCDAAQLQRGDVIVEIGPGTGILTAEILKRGCRVIALEADQRALAVLEHTFKDEIACGNLILEHTDARTLDVSRINTITDGEFSVIANIPYYLSGLLFRIFLQSPVQPKTLVYLVQKEVAKRICSDISRGEKESLLSLSVKAYGEPEYVKAVTRGHFTPPPKIDSGIVAVRNISHDNFTILDESTFFEILHLGFGQKRKQLLGNLSKQYDRSVLIHIFSTLSLPLSTRAEDVPLEKWLTLCAAIVKL